MQRAVADAIAGQQERARVAPPPDERERAREPRKSLRAFGLEQLRDERGVARRVGQVRAAVRRELETVVDDAVEE